MARVNNWQLGREMSYWYPESRPNKQFAAVFDTNKCIACQTCTLACKTTWTSGLGQEYMLWNNVETKPYGFYPLAWDLKLLEMLDGQKWSERDYEGQKLHTYEGQTIFESAPAGERVLGWRPDEYYLFYSGGHSGNVYVAGVPSMRHISTIPVFAAYPATGYGFDEESKKLLGGFTWGDVHHPALSETKGDYDGRWLFVNDNANNRVARIDLRDFKTKQILGPVPNISGYHGGSFVTPNTEYVLAASRFSVPLPKGSYAPIEEYGTKYNGVIAGVKVDPKTGEMSPGFQILMPPFNFDLGDAGKGPSEGWAFWTSYNTERATGKLEVTSTQKDRDYIAAVNWKEAEKAVTAGKAKMIGGVPVLDPKEMPGVVFLIPCSKSPHGVDVSPDGKYFIGSG